ncbi:MAG: hypothetical protein Q8S73_40885 [Deltaproteobacteria bacterium]|jgi:hypothetical protein|nr:hypothetical protein [Myxococcales bacterium]MDP3220520.1 hypothetical protein [Deltaproteobacteria bacterium]
MSTIRWSAHAGPGRESSGIAESVDAALVAARAVYRDGVVRVYEDDVEVIVEESVLDDGTGLASWQRVVR